MMLVAGLAPWRLGFDPGPVHAGFVVDKLAMGPVLLRVLRFYPVTIIPRMLHTYPHLHVIHTRMINGRILKAFQKAMHFRKIGEHCTEETFNLYIKEIIGYVQ
jgi:hypothetical protein